MKASWTDFLLMVTLISNQPLLTPEDWEEKLPLERARHWLPLITRLHIPQQALLRVLEGTMFYEKDEAGIGWKDFIKSLLDRRARVALALDYAIRRHQPVEWE